MAQQPADPMLGRILLGRYRILGELGEGGMGKVYLAEQKMGTATRKVAIKTLHPDLTQDPHLVARFHRESETVIALTHPNTIQFYDFGELDDTTLFIVMEYIEGESLAHVLQRGPVAPHRVDRLLIQICGSLQEAHHLGVVHRDLKPENVLLTDRAGQTDFVKVLDFGIAKRQEAEDSSRATLTRQGMILGTPPYMSPEQFSGQALDARSDIYSLGVMTYEMLTGCLPFEANTPWEWATKHLTAEPTPLESQPAGAALSNSKKQAIMRALSKDRDARQATAVEFLQELTGYQDAQAAWTMATAPGAAVARAATPAQGANASLGGGPGGAAQHTPEAFHATMASGALDQAQIPGLPQNKPPPRRWPWLVGLSALAIAGSSAAFLAMGNPTGPASERNAVAPRPEPTASPPAADDRVPTQVASPQLPPKAEARASDEDVRDDTQEEAGEQGADNAPAKDDEDQASPRKRPRTSPSKRKSALDAEARALLSGASSAIRANDIRAAVGALRAAQRKLGRSHSALRSLRGQLSQRASNQVGILMQQGRCNEAQALYRQLRSVGAGGAARQHFSPEWCPRP